MCSRFGEYGSSIHDHFRRREWLPDSIAAASNEFFSSWTKTLTDPRLCTAIVDRLTFNGTIIETGTDSGRIAHTIAQHFSPPRRFMPDGFQGIMRPWSQLGIGQRTRAIILDGSRSSVKPYWA